MPTSLSNTSMIFFKVQIDEVLYCQDNDERQVGDTKFNLSLKARDLKCLQPGFWLTDLVNAAVNSFDGKNIFQFFLLFIFTFVDFFFQIIDYYFGLIAESNPRIYSLTSHFYPKLVQEGFEGVKEWFSNVSDLDNFSTKRSV